MSIICVFNVENFKMCRAIVSINVDFDVLCCIGWVVMVVGAVEGVRNGQKLEEEKKKS